jgi:isoquinoline 1-oxidoreductase alpha subunit
MAIGFELNGQRVEVEAAPDTPLLWVLRDHLGLTGTKFGCGAAHCGACTVYLDGAPARSCQVPLSEVGARRVTSIEGLAGPVAEAVQTTWDALQVPQCGYCQSGQVMAAAALLAKNAAPSDAEIDEALRGNLCRCGTYPRIRRAVHEAGRKLRSAT